jgi:citrate synthase
MQTIARTDSTPIEVPRGLTNVIAAETRLSGVRGGEGFYHYRQYSATELAAARPVEDVWRLLLDGVLPDADEARAFAAEVAEAATPPAELASLLPAVAASTPDPQAALRSALSLAGGVLGLRPLYDLEPGERRRDVLRIAALVPSLVAGLDRHRRGRPVVPAEPDVGIPAGLLRGLGLDADPARTRLLGTYLALAIDHGFNASTFTTRVIASTGADAASCLVGGLGALFGPLHGGAPTRVLDTLDAIGDPTRIDAWLIERILAGDRIMGFGHAVYRTEDPRSVLLEERVRAIGGDRVAFAIAVKERAEALLAELKPGRELHVNLEWFAAVALELCGIDRALFGSVFAVARAMGWAANVLEQADDPKIIRPSSRYVGPVPPVPVPAR